MNSLSVRGIGIIQMCLAQNQVSFEAKISKLHPVCLKKMHMMKLKQETHFPKSMALVKEI